MRLMVAVSERSVSGGSGGSLAILTDGVLIRRVLSLILSVPYQANVCTMSRLVATCCETVANSNEIAVELPRDLRAA